MQETEKDMYFEMFGLGNLLSIFLEDYFRYVMPGLVILVIVIKLVPDWLERYNSAPDGVKDGDGGEAPLLKHCREFMLKYFNGRTADLFLKLALLPAILILLVYTAYLNIRIFVSVFTIMAVLGGMLAVMKYQEIKEEGRAMKKGGYRRKQIKFFGKSALNEGNHRNLYLDMLGIGFFVSLLKSEWFHWIMLGTLILTIIVRLVDMAMEFYSEVSFERYMEKKAREDEVKRRSGEECKKVNL